jgi:hypothetical protein
MCNLFSAMITEVAQHVHDEQKENTFDRSCGIMRGCYYSLRKRQQQKAGGAFTCFCQTDPH